MVDVARRSVVLGLVTAGLSGCAAPLQNAKPSTSTPAVAVTEAEMVAQINAVRVRNGSHPLRFNPILAAAARNQAEEMARRDALSHDFGPGLDMRSRVRSVGYVGPVGENVAGGQPTLEAAIAAWMHSGGHRYTLLLNDWQSFGMAVVTKPGSRYRVFWAADFGV